MPSECNQTNPAGFPCQQIRRHHQKRFRCNFGWLAHVTPLSSRTSLTTGHSLRHGLIHCTQMDSPFNYGHGINYLDLQVHHPNMSPWYNKALKAWQRGTECPKVPFRKRCRWFMNFITRTWKHLKVELPLRLCRPTSDVLQFWCPSVTVMVDPARTAAIDQMLARWRTRYVEWKDLDHFGM